MSEEEYDDKIAEDPDDQVDDDEMSPAEAGFAKGAEAEEEKKKKKEEDDDDEEEDSSDEII